MSDDIQEEIETADDTTEATEPILMEVKGLMLDPVSNVPIVVLRGEDSSQFLPIWIGVFEANAIALCLEEVEVPRPMTHDLTINLLLELDTVIDRIVVTDLLDSTFYARIHLVRDEEEFVVDSRPSDAIALALRVEAPIFVVPEVLAKAKLDDRAEQLSKDERIRKWLEDLDPDDLGEYTM